MTAPIAEVEVTAEHRPRNRSPRPFWSQVHFGPSCWEWMGGHDAKGYGLCSVRRRSWRVHRLTWTMRNGPIPAGLFVLHECDNPKCVRPEHLFLGDHDDNMADKVKKKRQSRIFGPTNGGGRYERAKTHCPRGQEYSESNTHISKANGSRHCRECNNIRKRASYVPAALRGPK